MENLKDRTEGFDDYYPCKKKNAIDCTLIHVYHWMVLFRFLHNLSRHSGSDLLNYLTGDENKP